MHTNYGAISRTDDEPYDAEGEWVAERTTSLVAQRRRDRIEVASAIADALSDDGEDRFARILAAAFVRVEELPRHRPDSEFDFAAAAVSLWRELEPYVEGMLRRDAETDAQHEWDTRQTGPDDH